MSECSTATLTEAAISRPTANLRIVRRDGAGVLQQMFVVHTTHWMREEWRDVIVQEDDPPQTETPTAAPQP